MYTSPSPLLRPFASMAMVRRAAFVAALLSLPGTAAAQLGAGVARATRLEATTKSAMAVTEFNAAMFNVNNVQPAKATAHLKRALELDPSIGIARAFYAVAAPNLSRTERITELDRAVADAARASAPELLVATATRARFQGDLVQAQTLLRSAAMLLPNDPNIAIQLAVVTGQVPGNRFTDGIAPMRNMTTRFPDYAPTFNLLAYSLWRTGDRAGALANVKMYVDKLPNEANPHDSYAEILQWSGRLEEALVEYRRAASIDPTFTVAALGQAEVYAIMGKPDLARAAIADALPRVTAPATKLVYLRAIAGAYFLDGNLKATQTHLAAVADEAKAQNNSVAVGGTHASMAIADAVLGDGRGVANHVAMFGSEMSAIDRAYYSGLAYAIGKQNALARTALDDLKRVRAGNETEGTSRWIPILSAMILINEGKGQEAITVISATDLATPLTRAVLALAEQSVGNVGAARSLRDEILGDRAIILDNGPQITARRLVKRII